MDRLSLRYWLASGALAAILAAPAPIGATPSASPARAQEDGWVHGQVILRLRPEIARELHGRSTAAGSVTGARFHVASLDTLAWRFGVREIRPVLSRPNREARGMKPSPLDPYFLLVFNPSHDARQAAAELRRDPAVESAQLVYVYTPDRTPNDPLYPQQLEHQATSMPLAWDQTTGQGPNRVTIAIIGQGMQLDHPDLAPNIIPGYDFADQDPDPGPGPGEGHETAVAGVAAAVGDNLTGIAGVCWGCRILPLRVDYTTFTVAQAIDYAAARGARVINMSFGSYDLNKYGPDTVVGDAVEAAVAGGAVVVATAGNDSIDLRRYPGALENVLGVASSRLLDSRRAASSNFGSWVDVAAPGAGPYSTTVDSQYGHVAGTSFAAPCVAGIAGLILSKNPSLSPLEVRRMIEYSSDRVVTDRYLGTGRVNAARAVGLDAPPSLFAIIKSPENGPLTGFGTIDIWGTALGNGYVLEYRPRASPTWSVLTTGPEIVNGTLGTLDVGPLPEGYYDLRLTSIQGPSQVQDSISIYRPGTWPEHPGWPRIGGTVVLNSPTYSDLDGDGVQEILMTGNHQVHVWRLDGSVYPGWPQAVAGGSPAGVTIGDLEGDGAPEIVSASRADGRVSVWRRDGSTYPGFPKYAGAPGGSDRVWAPVTLASLDAAPGLEMVVTTVGGTMHVWNAAGYDIAGWPKQLDYNVQAPAAIGDLDRDGSPEIVVRQWVKIYAFKTNGASPLNWPIQVLATGHTQPIIADMDGDGLLDVIDQEANTGVALYNRFGTWIRRWNTDTINTYTALSIGNLDGTGGLEAFVGDEVGNLFGYSLTGPGPAYYQVSTLSEINSAPLIADFDADGQKELLVASRDGGVFIWNADRTIQTATRLGEEIDGSAAVGDLDGNGDIEVVVATASGTVHVFDVPAPFDPDTTDWRMEHGDPTRSGHFRLREERLTPTNLQASASTTNSREVNLSWTAPASPLGRVTGYEVLRNGARIALVGPGISFTDSDTELLVSYQYAVRALDDAGYLSFPSNTADMVLVDTIPPTPPANLYAALGPRDGSHYTVNLGWSAAADDLGVTRYRGYRDGKQIFDQGADTRWFVDSRLRDGVTYAYVVRALDGAGNVSAASSVLQVTPPGGPIDCDPADPTIWSTPGEVTGLFFEDETTLRWVEPLQAGGTTPRYDTLRSSTAFDFLGTGQCVESGDSADTMAADAALPAPGEVFFYLVRAGNACPQGDGTLGPGSDGLQRQGITCP